MYLTPRVLPNTAIFYIIPIIIRLTFVIFFLFFLNHGSPMPGSVRVFLLRLFQCTRTLPNIILTLMHPLYIIMLYLIRKVMTNLPLMHAYALKPEGRSHKHYLIYIMFRTIKLTNSHFFDVPKFHKNNRAITHQTRISDCCVRRNPGYALLCLAGT